MKLTKGKKKKRQTHHSKLHTCRKDRPESHCYREAGNLVKPNKANDKLPGRDGGGTCQWQHCFIREINEVTISVTVLFQRNQWCGSQPGKVQVTLLGLKAHDQPKPKPEPKAFPTSTHPLKVPVPPTPIPTPPPPPVVKSSIPVSFLLHLASLQKVENLWKHASDSLTELPHSFLLLSRLCPFLFPKKPSSRDLPGDIPISLGSAVRPLPKQTHIPAALPPVNAGRRFGLNPISHVLVRESWKRVW